MTELEGSIEIELHPAQGGLSVSIRSSRPVAASRVFAGKGVAETAAGLPALYSICATAQAFACAAACEAALGLAPPPPEMSALRRRLVAAETMKEHLWRMLLDWPRFLGGASDAPAMARVLAAFRRLRETAGDRSDPFRPGAQAVEPDGDAFAEGLARLVESAAGQVFGLPVAVWLARATDEDGLLGWARDAETPAARLVAEVFERGCAGLGRAEVPALPPLPAEQLEARLGGEHATAFVAEPTWHGAPAETSPFTRSRSHALVAALAVRFGSGLLTRLASQLVELALLLEALSVGRDLPAEPASVAPRPGVGIAQVQAARGLLVHRVSVSGDRVADYLILAPTEWNFHPRGAVALGLASLPSADEAALRRLAGLFVTAVDPCVEYHLTIG